MKELTAFYALILMIVVIMYNIDQPQGIEESIANEPVINIHHSGMIQER